MDYANLSREELLALVSSLEETNRSLKATYDSLEETNNSLLAALKQSSSLTILFTTSFKIKDLKELLTVIDDCCLGEVPESYLANYIRVPAMRTQA